MFRLRILETLILKMFQYVKRALKEETLVSRSTIQPKVLFNNSSIVFFFLLSRFFSRKILEINDFNTNTTR